MKKRQRNFAIGTAVVAGISYVAGILTAPKSGKATRKDIQKKAAKTKKEAEKNLKQLHTELSDLIDQGKVNVEKAKSSTKKEMNEAIDRAQDVKERARNLLSSLHEGDDEDRDLEKAIKEADKAINHLKSYIGKNAAKKPKK